MRFISKVGEMLWCHPHKSSNEEMTKEAIARVRSVGMRADELNMALQKYVQADDPFRAFAVDVFEREQESKIHYGPHRGSRL